MSQLKGGGGKPKTPPSPVNTPDNLRSEDVVEMVLGLSEGPIEGLSNGAKSFYVGETALERQDGSRNFEEFELKVLPGEAEPESLIFKLGGEASNNQVGVGLAHGVPLTRQTQDGNIDAIDVRLVVQSLYKSVEEGKNPGVFDNTFEFKIRYKPVSATEWADWYEAAAFVPGTGNPHVSEYDSSWSPDSYQVDGVWYDPQDIGKTWSSSGFMTAILWMIDQQNNQPGGWNPPNGLYIRGKTTSTYVKEYRIPVQRIPEPYEIQVERISPDSSLTGDPRYIAEVQWESYQTIDKLPKRYPHTALVHVSGRSTDQFTSVPQMSGIYKGLIVRVPTNFDPIARTYTGTWDGLWKTAWTDSPVWLLYEAIHNDRWGWAAYTNVNWSKYEAYDLAQITDHILPNGRPRYTFNAYLTETMDGREFCRYLAGSFNSIIVDDNNGNVRVLMDKDDAAVDLIGPESIIGDFEYTYTETNTRFNDLTVVFRNKVIDYNEDRRRIKSQEQIDQFGRIPFDFVAVGCTNENEALRKASRRLVSATTETEMVNFKINRRATNWSPYEIILVTDPYKGYGESGRFKSYSGSTITLRDPLYLEAGVPYGLSIQSEEGVITRTLTSVTTGWTTTLTVNTALDSFIYQKAQFSLTHAGSIGLPKPYRILSLSESGDDDWSVMAIEVNRLKFAAEDEAEIVGEPEYTFVRQRNPAPPTNLVIENLSRASPDGTMVYEARVDFTPPNDAYVRRYEVRFRQVGETEYEVRDTDGSGLVVQLPRDGMWEFQVQSKNIWNQQSPWISPLGGPVDVDKLTSIFGGAIVSTSGGLNEVTIKVAYPDQTDIRYARIYYSTANNVAVAQFSGRTDSDTYVHTGITGIQTLYYWVKFEDNLGNVGPYTTTVGASATTTAVTAEDIAAGAVTLEKFANGLAPVEIHATLPTTGNFVGRTVVLTTDGKLYTWNGTEWVTPASEMAGVGVETVNVLPTTGNFEGRIVYLTTDDKLYRHNGTAWISTTAASDLTGQIVATQIANGAVTTAKFATGLTGVEILTTLPTTGNFNGRTVYLTTDGKLYRYSGSSFTATVPATDLSGTIAGSQIANGAISITKFASGLSPVEIVATLPTTGNFEGRMVYLTTDDKLYRYNGTSFISTTAATDLTGQITTTQITDNAITTGKIAANAVTATQILAGSITTGKIAAGAVTATEVAAGAITASKLVVMDTSNMYPDPNLTDPASLTGTFTFAASVTLTSSRNVVWIVPSAVDTSAATDFIPVEAGKPYFFSSELSQGGGTDANQRMMVIWYAMNSAGATTDLGAVTVGALNTALGTVTVSNTLTAPVNARLCKIVWFRYGGGTANTYYGSPVMRRATNGELIVDGAITAGKIAAGAITAGTLAAGAVTAGTIAANAVTTGTIAAGAITAAQVAAGAITVGKLAVIDNTNLVLDSTFSDPVMWALDTSTPPWTFSTDAAAVAALSSTRVAKSGVPSGTTHEAKYDQIQYNGRAPVELGGKPLRVNLDWYVTAGFTGLGRVYVYQYNPAGAYIGAIMVGATTDYRSTAAAAATTGSVTAIVNPDPATGTITIGMELQRSPTLNNAGYMYLANFRASRAVNAEVIVDGSITATKLVADSITATQIAANAITASELAANAVTAGKIAAGAVTAGTIVAGSITGDRLVANTITAGQIAAGSITTTQIGANTIVAANIAAGAITATEIASGAVTAVKINVTNLAAITANLGAITAGSLDIGGKFIVASDGSVTIRNATTGARLVLTNTLVQVYDASNVLRVRLGIW